MGTDVHAQTGFRIRLDWGLDGARNLASIDSHRAIFAVVDVLSFTTAVSVACDLGIEVFPYRWVDERAAEFAAGVDAVLAADRSGGGISLSPASIRTAVGLERLVLPSPNGSTITASLQSSGGIVVAACLRNSRAAGRWIADRLAAEPDRHLAVIAAGEHWADGRLRPAVEDHWGAGAVISAVLDSGRMAASPEAATAALAYRGVAADLPRLLMECASGRELAAASFAHDVVVAAEMDASAGVPVLDAGRYRPAAR